MTPVGTAPFAYQWYKGATAVGNGSSSLTLNPAGVADSGTYTVVVTGGTTLTVTSGNAVVTVSDTTPPFISLNGNPTDTVECHTSYSDAGATASDSCAGTLAVTPSSLNINLPGVYTVTYTATDGFNAVSVTRVVTVQDTVAPSISLNSTDPLNVVLYSTFSDPSA